MRPLGSITGGVGLYKGKWAYCSFPSAHSWPFQVHCALSDASGSAPKLSTVSQASGLLISSEKQKYLQMCVCGGNMKLSEGNSLFTTKSNLVSNRNCLVINSVLDVHLN